MTLEGTGVLVVGASAGIGRSFAEHAAKQGARVVVTGRRAELLAEVGGCHGIAADIADAGDRQRLIDATAAHLGTIDVVMHAVGTGTVSHIAQPDADSWAWQYAVNVIGPTCITAGLLPHLSANAIVSFMSSEATGEPRWGMSAYTATKAALEATIRSWRMEHPERRFQRIVMGATMPTDFGTNFDPDILGVAFERWTASGISMTAMETDDVGRHLAELFAVLVAHPDIDVPDLQLDPRGEPWQ